jgi:hypothetical protein
MSSEKRKKVVVSMEQKLEALQRLDKGGTMQKWQNMVLAMVSINNTITKNQRKLIE